jgi:hypothetical protein
VVRNGNEVKRPSRVNTQNTMLQYCNTKFSSCVDKLKLLQVEGKIVVFNTPWSGRYDSSIRSTGARRAAEKGAVAALIRSVTQFSIGSPHTGHMVSTFIEGIST